MSGTVRPLWGLRLIVCTREKSKDPLEKLPFPDSTFQLIRQTLDLPKHLLRAAAEQHEFLTEQVGEGPSAASGTLGVLLRLIGFEEDDCCLGFSYNPETCMTHALILGLFPRDGKQPADDILQKIDGSAFPAWHPIFLPLMLLEMRSSVASKAVAGAALLGFEYDLADHFEKLFRQLANPGKGSPESTRKKFEEATFRLNRISTELNLIELVLESLRRCCQKTTTLVDKVQQLQRSRPITHHDRIAGAAIRNDAEYISSVIDAMLLRLIQIQKKIGIQLSVNLNFLAQTDNRANMSLAIQSKLLAVSSKRDSSSMKTIAVLTMVFLPGTYVAAFFTLPFFQWDAGEGESITTSRFWIYWVVTVPLTVAVLGAWVVWMKFVERQEKAEEVEVDDATSSGTLSALHALRMEAP